MENHTPDPGLPEIDATTFRTPLRELAETIAQKVNREGRGKMSNAPAYVSTDLFVMIRYAMRIYSFYFYIHNDELQKGDPFWDQSFTFVASPTIRSLIDILYNVTFILESPAVNGALFRRTGFKKELSDLQEERNLYGTEPEWARHLAEKESHLELGIRSSNMTRAEVEAELGKWKTLGSYLSTKGPGGTLTPHQQFLQRLTYGSWRNYSAISHAGFEGLLDIAPYLTRDSQTHKIREKMDLGYPQLSSMHMGRVALLLLALITEVQASLQFDGADIGPRLHRMWHALMPIPEAKELYTVRYQSLMATKGIKPQ